MTASTATAPADEVTPYARKALIASDRRLCHGRVRLPDPRLHADARSAPTSASRRPQAASLATWTLLGAVAGGIGFGILSDHLRPRPGADLDDPAVCGLHRPVARFAQGYWDLAALPHHRRARARRRVRHRHGAGGRSLAGPQRARVSVLCRARLAGGRARARRCVTPLLLPAIGWRGMFVVGLVPALVALRWCAAPSASRRCSSSGRRAQELRRAPWRRLRLLVKDAATAKISLGMLILCSVQNFGYYGMMIWMPSYLARGSASACRSRRCGPR